MLVNTFECFMKTKIKKNKFPTSKQICLAIHDL